MITTDIGTGKKGTLAAKYPDHLLEETVTSEIVLKREVGNLEVDPLATVARAVAPSHLTLTLQREVKALSDGLLKI